MYVATALWCNVQKKKKKKKTALWCFSTTFSNVFYWKIIVGAWEYFFFQEQATSVACLFIKIDQRVIYRVVHTALPSTSSTGKKEKHLAKQLQTLQIPIVLPQLQPNWQVEWSSCFAAQRSWHYAQAISPHSSDGNGSASDFMALGFGKSVLQRVPPLSDCFMGRLAQCHLQLSMAKLEPEFPKSFPEPGHKECICPDGQGHDAGDNLLSNIGSLDQASRTISPLKGHSSSIAILHNRPR